MAGTPRKKGALKLKLTKVGYAESASVSRTVVIPGDPRGVIVAKLTVHADSGERLKLTAT